MGLDFYRQRDALTVEHKGDDLQDVVSIADKQIEAFIRERLTQLFPEDGFLGEESGSADLGARCVWVIDPIDGTACFVNGLHNWCVSIGLVFNMTVRTALRDPSAWAQRAGTPQPNLT